MTDHQDTDRPLTAADLQRVADEEEVRVESVLRAAMGIPVRGRAGVRAARAAAKLLALRTGS